MDTAPSLSGKSGFARRVVRYGFAGVFATALYSGAVFALVELMGIAAVPAAVVATLIVMVTSYTINRAWVFETNRPHVSSFTRFALASLVSIGLNTGLMYLAVHVFEWRYVGGLILATAIVPPVNFVMNYAWAFRRAGDV